MELTLLEPHFYENGRKVIKEENETRVLVPFFRTTRFKKRNDSSLLV